MAPVGMHALLTGQLTGVTPRTLRQLNATLPWIFSRLDRESHGMGSLLLELESALYARQLVRAHPFFSPRRPIH
jgi:hypothetical protein